MKTAQLHDIGTPSAADRDGTALDAIFAALSDPIRRAIVARLAHGTCSVTALGAPFAVSAPAISKHLAVLERCALIERRKIGRVHFCRLRAEPLANAAGWIAHQRDFWQRQLESLAAYLEGEKTSCAPSPGASRG